MIDIAAILEGHKKELFGEDQELAEERLKICRKCPIYSEVPIAGPMCSSNKWISEDGTQVSDEEKEGYKQGCGCRLSAKTRLINAHCIVFKW